MLRKANTDYAEKNTNLHNEVEELKTRWDDFYYNNANKWYPSRPVKYMYNRI